MSMTPEHNHWFKFIYHHSCRACEIARFHRQLPGSGLPKEELHQFVMSSPTLTSMDKVLLIERYGL